MFVILVITTFLFDVTCQNQVRGGPFVTGGGAMVVVGFGWEKHNR